MIKKTSFKKLARLPRHSFPITQKGDHGAIRHDHIINS